MSVLTKSARRRHGTRRQLICILTAVFGATAVAAADDAVSRHGSERLQQLMRRMDTLIYERNQSELEIDKERLRRARELADIALQLAGRASELRPDSATAAAAAREFNLYAQRLADEAIRLGEIAEQRRYAELSPQIERLGHQCAACHLRFRQRTR